MNHDPIPVGARVHPFPPIHPRDGAVWCEPHPGGYVRYEYRNGVWEYVSDTIPTYEVKHDPS